MTRVGSQRHSKKEEEEEILIINYGIIMNSISTLMYTLFYVEKYKITFKLVINRWTNEIM
jgi:hypothetical protein